MTQSASLPKWEPPTPTTYPLDPVSLTVIDLALFDTDAGKLQLVDQIRSAVHDVGFWLVKNTGFSEDEVREQFAIGLKFFEQPLEERNKVCCAFERGHYFGYRGAFERTVLGTTTKDNMELVNLPKFTEAYAHEPRHEVFTPFLPQIESFSRRCWDNIARKLYVLFALVLELPEDYFVERHAYERPSEDHLRYMRYHPRTAEEDALVDNLWAQGHTDYGSLTLLASQNVSGLQLKDNTGAWKDVPPLDGTFVVNVGDTLSFLTKGYLKSTIHRVHAPPPDQAHIRRVGVIFGCRPNDDTPVVPAPSPVLFREGLITEDELAGKVSSDRPPTTTLEYLRARVSAVHAPKSYGAENGSKFAYKNLEIVANYA